jgi:hypothetical protein
MLRKRLEPDKAPDAQLEQALLLDLVVAGNMLYISCISRLHIRAAEVYPLSVIHSYIFG